jgi:uncharacterized membrane protein YbhN (UPF0104 family)
MFRRILSTTLLFLSLGFLVWYLSQYGDKFKALGDLRLWQISVLGALGLFQYVTGSLVLVAVLSGLGRRLPFYDSFLLFSLSQYWNYLPGRMGTVVRAMVLKTRYQIPYYMYVVYMMLPQILSAIFLGLLGVIFCFIVRGSELELPVQLPIFFMILSLVGFLLIRLRITFFLKKIPEMGSLPKAVSSWEVAIHQKMLLLRILGIHILSFLVQFVRWFFLFLFLTGQSGVLTSFFVSLFDGLGALISVTPASLGVSEALIASSAIFLDITVPDMVFLALVSRMIAILVALPTGVLSQFLLNRKMP